MTSLPARTGSTAAIFALAGALGLVSTADPVSAEQSWLASQWQVGGMVLMVPRYEGSKSYTILGYPIVAPAGIGASDGLVQFKGLDDLRFRLVNIGGVEAGPLLGYRFGRDESDGRLLRGLGDVDGGLVAGGYVGYRAGWFFPFASYHHQVTGDDGGAVARFGVELKPRMHGRIAISTTIGTTWADETYMHSYFGVDAVQSLRSGLRVHGTDAGIKDVYIATSADFAIDDRWTIKLMGRWARLLGDAGTSTVVESKDQLYAGVGLTYRLPTR